MTEKEKLIEFIKTLPDDLKFFKGSSTYRDYNKDKTEIITAQVVDIKIFDKDYGYDFFNGYFQP